MSGTLGLVISSLGGLYLLAVLLRFMLQVARADFYNPVSQAVWQITEPMVRIFRVFIPKIKGVDLSSLVLAFVVQGILICLLLMVYGAGIPSVGFVVTYAVVGNLYFIINIYRFAIIGAVIMSLIMMFSGHMGSHPLLNLVRQLTEPLLGPVRSIIPPMGGLDFSPFLIYLALFVLLDTLRVMFSLSNYAAVIVGV